MKEESRLLINDARESLLETSANEARQNPLAAAFLGWLLRGDDLLSLMEEAARSATAEKGAKRNSRSVAVLGFACGVDSLKSQFVTAFHEQLEWLMGRPNFAAGGEPCGAVADPINLAGIVAGAEQGLDSPLREQFNHWAAAAWKDADGLLREGDWRRDLLNALKGRISAEQSTGSEAVLSEWMAAALHRMGWGAPKEQTAGSVLRTVLAKTLQVKDGFESGLYLAAMGWAIGRAIDFDMTALTVADIAAVLRRVPSIFQRWTWEDRPRTSRQGAEARRWYIDNEYHFQSILYAVLKPLIPELDEERYLPPTGTYQPRADLCVQAIGLVIEVKFWYQNKSVKDLTEEIAADLSLYLRPDSPYEKMIAAIWDDGARTERQSELQRGLKGLNGLFDVVMVNRPAFMK